MKKQHALGKLSGGGDLYTKTNPTGNGIWEYGKMKIKSPTSGNNAIWGGKQLSGKTELAPESLFQETELKTTKIDAYQGDLAGE